MLTLGYCVYDNKALVYGVPFFAPTDGSAIRSFQDLANDASTTVGRHPSDFSLFCVGNYDDQNGSLRPVQPLRHVVDATALLIRQPALPFDVRSDDPDVYKANGEAREAYFRDQGGNV